MDSTLTLDDYSPCYYCLSQVENRQASSQVSLANLPHGFQMIHYLLGDLHGNQYNGYINTFIEPLLTQPLNGWNWPDASCIHLPVPSHSLKLSIPLDRILFLLACIYTYIIAFTGPDRAYYDKIYIAFNATNSHSCTCTLHQLSNAFFMVNWYQYLEDSLLQLILMSAVKRLQR